MVKKNGHKSIQELFEELRPHQQSLPLQWDDDIVLKIMELEPLMMFFRMNFKPPTDIEISQQINKILATAKNFAKCSDDFHVNTHTIHYEERFQPPVRGFTLDSLEFFKVCSLRFQLYNPLSLKLLFFDNGIADIITSNFSENFPDIFPIHLNVITYWQSKQWSEEEKEEFKGGLSEIEKKEFEESEYIENIKFEQPDYVKFGLWEYKVIEIYFDEFFHFYLSFVYYDEERESHLSGNVPISKEKLGEFYYYCKKIENEFGIYFKAT